MTMMAVWNRKGGVNRAATRTALELNNSLGVPISIESSGAVSIGCHGSARIARFRFGLIALAGEVHAIGNRPTKPETVLGTITSYWLKERENFVQKLTGEFALFIWDEPSRRLLCVRDHAGLKPLFWTPFRNQILFSTDIKHLISRPFGSPGINEVEMGKFLLEYGEAKFPSATLHTGIHRVDAGHFVLTGPDFETVTQYWRPQREELRCSGELVDQACHLIEQSVACRVRSKKKQFGAHFSGGLDSSLVAAVASRHLRRSNESLFLQSWARSPILPLAKNSEHHRIRAVSAREGLECHHLDLTPELWSMGYEVDASLVPPSSIFWERLVLPRFRAEGVKKILSGWGGDQGISFYGWGWPSCLLAEFRLGPLIRLARSESKNMSKLKEFFGILRFVWFHGILPLLPDTIYPRFAPFKAEHASQLALLKPSFRQFLNVNLEPTENYRRYATPFDNQAAHFNLGSIARRTEAWHALGQKHGIEYSYPLLDRRLLDFVFSLPPEVYWNKNGKRIFFREVSERYIPSEVAWAGDAKGEPDHFQAMKSIMDEGFRLALNRIMKRASFYKSNPWIDTDKLWKAAAQLDSLSPPSDRKLVVRALHALKVWEYHCAT